MHLIRHPEMFISDIFQFLIFKTAILYHLIYVVDHCLVIIQTI